MPVMDFIGMKRLINSNLVIRKNMSVLLNWNTKKNDKLFNLRLPFDFMT